MPLLSNSPANSVENCMQYASGPAFASPSRTPLSENPTPPLSGEHPKTEGKYKTSTSRFQAEARVLFADPIVLRRGENAGACIPIRTPISTKAHNSQHSLYGTPPRTRKGAGKQPAATNASEASGNNQGAEIGTRIPPASKALASFLSASRLSDSQHALTPRSSNSGSLQIDQKTEQFLLKQHKDFWKDHNVQVLIRIRPLSSSETAANGTSMCLRQESPHALTWVGQPESRFTFDHVACASTTQEDLFGVAGLPMVDNCIEGYNSSIFAYGQTGSGKTYTMLGAIEAIDHETMNPKRGMTPRIFDYLFTKIEMEAAARIQEHLTFTCKCSFLEIYNEQITDLLEPTSTNLQIHEDPKKGLFVENLKEIEVKNARDILKLLLQGAANRRVAQTRMNQESSRSHSVFTCVVESKWVIDSMTSFRFGRLNLVDLAGSERQKASGAEGERLREAANINKSLSTLGLVIMILVDAAHGKQRHVPYRDSKLTFLLQDSLGGNSKTAIIATVSPSISCANETLNTLKFAQRAKFIQNNAIINEDASGDIMALRSQIRDLKEELEQLRKQTQSSKNSPLATIKNTQMSDTGEKLPAEYVDGAINSSLQKPKKAIETMLAGCLRREQAAVQEKDQLAAESQQLDFLIQAYEREINYVKTMLQLKEEKIQRLENVADTILSAEDYLQEENKALQQEVHLLQEQMNQNPKLLCFALENKRLIEQMRRQGVRWETLPHQSPMGRPDNCSVPTDKKELKDAHQSVAHMQKQLIVMESEMTSMSSALENKLQEAEAAWRGEKIEMLMELSKAKLDAAEKIGEASEALRRIKDGQETMKESDFMVSALAKANETARIQKLGPMSQWQGERQCLVTEIGELTNSIAQKEELQLKGQEVQQMLLKMEGVMVFAQREINALMLDSEQMTDSTTVSHAGMDKVSENLRKMSSFKEDFLKAISRFTNQLIVRKNNVFVAANTSIEDNTQQLPGELDSQTITLQEVNDRDSIQNHYGKGKQKQRSASEMEVMQSQYKQLEHGKAQLSTTELARKAEDMVKLRSELEDMKNFMLQVQKSHAVTKTILQERETEMDDLKTQLEEARHESDKAKLEEARHESDKAMLEKCEREQNFQNLLQKPVVEVSLSLQSYDKTTSLLLEKLEGIVARLSNTPGVEDAWVRFLNSFELALSKLEQDANSCLNFSNVICERLDKSSAKKELLEHELKRKQELLKGSFFDLSLLQENTVESTNTEDEIDEAILVIKSLQEELDSKGEQLKIMEVKYVSLECEKEKNKKTLLFLKTSLSEAQQYAASMERKNADLREKLEEALKRVESLEIKLEDRRLTIEELELELLNIKPLVEKKLIHALESVNQDLSSVVRENNQLHGRLLVLNEQLEATRLSADSNKRLAGEAQQIAEISKCHIQEKEKKVKLLERSIQELESTVNALESQVEILKREAETQQLSKEDLEMELQALRHQICYIHAVNTGAEQEPHHDLWSKKRRSDDTKQHQLLKAQTEILALRKEVADKAAEIKSLKLQVEELITAAEKQAAAHQQKLVLLETMVDNLNMENRETRQPIATTKKAGERSAAKCSTSPFKCMSSRLAQQRNFEMDEELQSDRRRIDELEDLAASRQKEIFRLNKRLAEAETVTYDVLRDLLGVKSDITTHTSSLDHKELQKMLRVALHHTKAALQKEKELQALQDQHNEERASWLEDTGRRQAKVVAAQVAVEKLRQKDFILKAENKRLKADLSRQKKRLVQFQDKMRTSLGQGNHDH